MYNNREVDELVLFDISATINSRSPDFDTIARDQQGNPLITIENDDVDTDLIRITQGQMVVWQNNDDETHIVRGIDNTQIQGTIDEGETFTYTFNTLGEFEYMIDDGERATIVVVESANTGTDITDDTDDSIVQIRNSMIEGSRITINTGDKVIFENLDLLEHTISGFNNEDITLNRLSSSERTFNQPGTFSYMLDDEVSGTIIVEGEAISGSDTTNTNDNTNNDNTNNDNTNNNAGITY